MSTPSKVPSKAKRSLDYAEVELGVHTTYAEAIRARNSLDTCLTQLSEMRDRKRLIEMSITDAEMEVASDEWGKHPEMSAARMQTHFKTALNNSTEVREFREELAKVVSEIDGLECDREIFRTDINIAVARLGELGGLLNYLTAIKLSQQNLFSRDSKET